MPVLCRCRSAFSDDVFEHYVPDYGISARTIWQKLAANIDWIVVGNRHKK